MRGGLKKSFQIVQKKSTTRSAMLTIVGRPIVGVTILLSQMNIQEKFGQKLKSLREEKSYSIEYLANISNVDRNYIADIEKGKRNISIVIMEKIILSLDLDISTFFADKIFKK